MEEEIEFENFWKKVRISVCPSTQRTNTFLTRSLEQMLNVLPCSLVSIQYVQQFQILINLKLRFITPFPPFLALIPLILPIPTPFISSDGQVIFHATRRKDKSHATNANKDVSLRGVKSLFPLQIKSFCPHPHQLYHIRASEEWADNSKIPILDIQSTPETSRQTSSCYLTLYRILGHRRQNYVPKLLHSCSALHHAKYRQK